MMRLIVEITIKKQIRRRKKSHSRIYFEGLTFNRGTYNKRLLENAQGRQNLRRELWSRCCC